MKRTLSVLMFAGAALAGLSAHAAPVFMLQFGSFESREEADQRLDALKTKHAGVLSRLQTGVRDVTLPPDNLTVYRTQAGPLATRADAQSVCSQLASNGDECYVVETAMMPNLSPVAATAAPAVKAEATPQVAQAPAPVVVPVPSAPVPPVPAAPRDMKNVDAMNRVTAVANAQAKPATPVVIATDDAMAAQVQRDLADAAKRQEEGFAASQAAQEKPIQKNRTFWDRLFGSDEVPAPAPQPAPSPNDAVQAVPVEPVSVAANPVVQAPITVKVAPIAAPAAPAVAVAVQVPPVVPQPVTAVPPAPAMEPIKLVPPASVPVASVAVAPVVIKAPEPIGVPLENAPRPVTVAASMQPAPLPPPPAPLNARAPVTVAVAPVVNATPVPPAPVAVAPMPVVNVPPAPPVAAVPAAQPAPFAMASHGRDVQVEEAKRVPLSQGTVPAVGMPALMPANVNPAATIGRKTLWAQVGPFRDAETARAYWDNYRMMHPDFPVVRVRVTTPLADYTRGVSYSTLRVGPFAQGRFIQNLCSTLVTPQSRLQCGPVVDLGQSTRASSGRGLLPNSRYNR